MNHLWKCVGSRHDAARTRGRRGHEGSPDGTTQGQGRPRRQPLTFYNENEAFVAQWLRNLIDALAEDHPRRCQ